MQKNADMFRYSPPIDVLREHLHKGSDELGVQHSLQQHLRHENLQLNFNPTKGIESDTPNAESQRSFLYKTMSNINRENRNLRNEKTVLMRTMQTNSRGEIGNIGNGSVNAVNSHAPELRANGKQQSLKSITRRVSQQMQEATPRDESDSNDTDNMNADHTASSARRSPHTDSPHSVSNASMGSFADGMFNESRKLTFSSLRKKNSSILVDNKSSIPPKIQPLEERSAPKTWPQEAHINRIMFLGLLCGLLVSKALQYLQMYFYWFQQQVLHLKLMFIGNGTAWELLHIDDTKNYGFQKKLLLLPLMGTFSILYGVVSCLHYTIRFMLAQTPNAMIAFLQKFYTEA